MSFPWLQVNSSIAIIGLVVLVGCAATYLLMQWNLKRRLQVMREQFDQALANVTAFSTADSSAVSVGPPAPPVSQIPKPNKSSNATSQPVQPVPVQQNADELAHETLVVIAAAVSAFLGKSVRLRSARLIHPSEGSAWAQQGRVFVQASHNLGLAPRLHG